MKNLTFALLTFLVINGCSDIEDSLANNDPNNYVLAEDVVWSSPEGMDLTLDIYTPNSSKSTNPVLIIFHGGGWLINDNSIICLLYTSPSPRDATLSRMPSSA